jgi:two-component system, chemotaxis family, protein-glutamate methylesterase/glutaminase
MVPAAVKRHGAIEAVVIGGSAGSIAVLGEILPGLPASFPSVLVVVHVPPFPPSHLSNIFGPRCAMRVREADAFEPIEAGTVYFAPADYHLLVEPDRRCALSIEPPVHFSRPAIDVLFESAAEVYGPALVGMVLTGSSADGARGLAAIHAAGGVAVVQDPATAEVPVMPRSAIAAVPSARVVGSAALLAGLLSLEERANGT